MTLSWTIYTPLDLQPTFCTQQLPSLLFPRKTDAFSLQGLTFYYDLTKKSTERAAQRLHPLPTRPATAFSGHECGSTTTNRERRSQDAAAASPSIPSTRYPKQSEDNDAAHLRPSGLCSRRRRSAQAGGPAGVWRLTHRRLLRNRSLGRTGWVSRPAAALGCMQWHCVHSNGRCLAHHLQFDHYMPTRAPIYATPHPTPHPTPHTPPHPAVYLIFGASGGIGSCLAKRLAGQSGATVVLAGRDQAKLDELKASLAGAAAGVVPLLADPLDSQQVGAFGGCGAGGVLGRAGKAPHCNSAGSSISSKPSIPMQNAITQAEAAVAQVAKDYGRVDGVANCVGSIVLKSAHTTSDADFEQVPALGVPVACTVCVVSLAAEGLELDSPQHARDTSKTPPPDPPQVLRVNLHSCFNILRPAVKAMMKQPGGGSVVFCSSAVAKHGIPNHEAIAAAKAGVQGGWRDAFEGQGGVG
jgi:NAD(P)-dependent dehydrogenase (short-subunit alcohol dehydrogenase family)